MALEKMDDFFENRLNGYENHQLNNIEHAKEFYTVTAKELPTAPKCKILDLGCGTGLELNEYFKFNKSAEVTGIDLAEGMLEALKRKFKDKSIDLICGSYFDVPFGKGLFDAAVSVESLHHFTFDMKVPLYKKIYSSLKKNGYFILTDYMIESEKEEAQNFINLEKLKKEQGISGGEFYHYDTPLTREHEKAALYKGGFSKVECIKIFGSTTIFKALK